MSRERIGGEGGRTEGMSRERIGEREEGQRG